MGVVHGEIVVTIQTVDRQPLQPLEVDPFDPFFLLFVLQGLDQGHKGQPVRIGAGAHQKLVVKVGAVDHQPVGVGGRNAGVEDLHQRFDLRAPQVHRVSVAAPLAVDDIRLDAGGDAVVSDQRLVR